jgi:YggT family protein
MVSQGYGVVLEGAAMLHYLIVFLYYALTAYFWIIILTVMVSWLVVFDVLNTRNKLVFKACNLLNAITNPLILRLRKVVPPLGGVDLTPMIVIFGIYFLQIMLAKMDVYVQTGINE